ncbi:MAG: N-acetylmuramoyl-L-alanine amidase [Lachnospiraceae bacterium]|nr:N-acetylmuramoyl-L-alanine amidase [Lachnospiraceae bacterium]
MPSIILDAGHGGYDNGASYNGRREKDDNLALALAVGRELSEQGYPVIYTRTEDVYDSPGQKARIANASGGDYFVSFHRNSSPSPNTYSGVETLVFDDNGVKAELARNINSKLAEVGFQDLGVKERTDLTVLKRTQMPSVLVETGFLNTDQDNSLFDQRFDQIARAIAEGIIETVGGAKQSLDQVYRIQIGLYNTFEQAQYALIQAVEQGYDGDVVPWRNYYAVQLGEFDTIDEARVLEQKLRRDGYDTLIVLN